MPSTKVVTGAAALLAAAALVGTGAALSSAATGTPTPSSSTAPSRPGGAGHSHTAVTGDELAKVTAAVKAKDAGVAVTSVQQDPDGSYDVFGTKAGAEVRLEVSKDLATITAAPAGRGGPGGPGGPGGHAHTAVTGDELAKVTAAVKAKDAGVAVTSVQQDPDGSYDVFGTKAGAEVRLEVSKDLTTITTGPGRPAAGNPDGAPGTDPDGTGTGTSSSSTSAGAVAPV
jgi:hypothetical protein